MRLSIRWKWTLALIAATTAPLVAAYFRADTLQRDGLRTVEQELEAAVVDQLSADISTHIATAGAFTRLATLIALDERIPSELRTAFLRERVSQTSSVGSLSLYGPKGEFFDAIVKESALTVAPEPLDPQLLRELRGAGSATRVDTFAGRARIRVYEAKHSEDEEEGANAEGDSLRLIACTTLDDQELIREAKRLSEVRFNAADRVDIVTWDGASGTLRSLLDPSRAQPSFLRFAEVKDSSNWVNEEFVRTAEFVNEHGELTLGTVRTVPEGKLAVTVTRPASEAYAALTRTREQFLLAIGALIVLAVALGMFIGGRRSRSWWRWSSATPSATGSPKAPCAPATSCRSSATPSPTWPGKSKPTRKSSRGAR